LCLSRNAIKIVKNPIAPPVTVDNIIGALLKYKYHQKNKITDPKIKFEIYSSPKNAKIIVKIDNGIAIFTT